jgi:hypothetical protein
MAALVKKPSLLLLLLGLIMATSNCIMEDRVVELVVSDSTCVDFSQNDTSATFQSSPVQVFLSDELDRILENNDVSREDIVAIKIVSASYGVTDFDQHDWTITGAIVVERIDEYQEGGPISLLKYTSQSVQAALNKSIPASLDSAGVACIDKALLDYINGGYPILEFQVRNSAVDPGPSRVDPIRFDWKACLWVDCVTKADLDVPDPF